MSADPARPFRDLCPEADERDAMSDVEFWEHVFPQSAPDDSLFGEDGPVERLLSLVVEPCPVCGSDGACAYDTEGRPLIHTDTELPEED